MSLWCLRNTRCEKWRRWCALYLVRPPIGGCVWMLLQRLWWDELFSSSVVFRTRALRRIARCGWNCCVSSWSSITNSDWWSKHWLKQRLQIISIRLDRLNGSIGQVTALNAIVKTIEWSILVGRCCSAEHLCHRIWTRTNGEFWNESF